MSKIKINKMCKIEIRVWEKDPWNLVNDGRFLFLEPTLVQKKVLEDLYGLGDTFNENRTSEFHNSEILK